MHPVGAGFNHHLAGDDGAVQVSAAGDDDSFGIENGTQLGADTGNTAVLRENFHNLSLLQL